MITFLYFVPKNLISYLFGILAVVPIPYGLRDSFYGWYAKRYGVAIEEATKDFKQYPSLQEFFVRDLKPELRPIGEGIVSPVDARVVQYGEILDGALIQAKGKNYSLAGLLKSRELASRFAGGSYVTLYLAPGDYHHIHSPVDARIVSSTYIPGALWPVNDQSVEEVDELFTKNERITTVLESTQGAFAVVKVGATNVGSIRTEYNDFRANPGAYLFGIRPSIVHQNYQPGIEIAKGERMATFYLGSTVILISENPKLFSSLDQYVGAQSESKIRFGETIGAQLTIVEGHDSVQSNE